MKHHSQFDANANITSRSLLFNELPPTDSELGSAASDSALLTTPVTVLRGVPRVKRPIRDQIEFRDMCVDELVPADHQVRAVWTFVMAQDLSSLFDKISAVEGEVGRNAIDPRILMALWLFATIDAVGSAREIARLTIRDNAYRWICGGVSVNHDRLSRFRAGSTELLDIFLQPVRESDLQLRQ